MCKHIYTPNEPHSTHQETKIHSQKTPTIRHMFEKESKRHIFTFSLNKKPSHTHKLALLSVLCVKRRQQNAVPLTKEPCYILKRALVVFVCMRKSSLKTKSSHKQAPAHPQKSPAIRPMRENKKITLKRGVLTHKRGRVKKQHAFSITSKPCHTSKKTITQSQKSPERKRRE